MTRLALKICLVVLALVASTIMVHAECDKFLVKHLSEIGLCVRAANGGAWSKRKQDDYCVKVAKKRGLDCPKIENKYRVDKKKKDISNGPTFSSKGNPIISTQVDSGLKFTSLACFGERVYDTYDNKWSKTSFEGTLKFNPIKQDSEFVFQNQHAFFSQGFCETLNGPKFPKAPQIETKITDSKIFANCNYTYERAPHIREIVISRLSGKFAAHFYELGTRNNASIGLRKRLYSKLEGYCEVIKKKF